MDFSIVGLGFWGSRDEIPCSRERIFGVAGVDFKKVRGTDLRGYGNGLTKYVYGLPKVMGTDFCCFEKILRTLSEQDYRLVVLIFR